jgi:iron complex transport system substrate-binding protein
LKPILKLPSLLILVLLLGLSLAACGDTPTATTSNLTTAATTTTPVATTTLAATTAAATTSAAMTTAPAPTIAIATTTATTRAATTTAANTGRKSAIIEPTPSFPRKIQAVNGVIEIKQKPQRIHTLSVGYDEITFRLVDASRIVAVGQSTADPSLSNVADLAAKVPLKVGRNAEQVIAAKPHLVIATPFSNKDLVKQIQDAGIPLAVTDLQESIAGHDENIRLLAYMYGEEQKGEELIKEINEQLARIDAVTAKQTKKPRVLFLQNNAYVSGDGSTGDGIIKRAGGINVATEAGIVGTKQISLESIIKMNPDFIILSDSPETNPKGFEQLTANPALAEVGAVKNKAYFGIKGAYLSTLSHWNIRGIEELVKKLYPGQL